MPPTPRLPLLDWIIPAFAMAGAALAWACPAWGSPPSNGYAELLAPEAQNPFGASDKALDMLGSRYLRGGSTALGGMDCSGFVYRSWKDATGADLPRTARAMADVLPRVAPHRLRPGDLLFFHANGRPFGHVGIYLGGGLFAHAPRPGSPARIDNLEAPYWLSIFDGARRPPTSVAR